MLIECTIHRDGGTFAEFGGITYHFAPNAEGAHVCEIKEEAAIDRFLSIPEGYRLARSGATAPKPVTTKPVEPNRKEPLPKGAPPDLESMTRDDLLQYAANLGMRKPHPSIKDDRLRANIALWLAERIEDVTAPFGMDDPGSNDDGEGFDLENDEDGD